MDLRMDIKLLRGMIRHGVGMRSANTWIWFDDNNF